VGINVNDQDHMAVELQGVIVDRPNELATRRLELA
jgi:hypothetical protein